MNEKNEEKIEITPITALGYLSNALSKLNCLTLTDARVIDASLRMLANFIKENAELDSLSEEKSDGSSVLKKKQTKKHNKRSNNGSIDQKQDDEGSLTV